MHCIPSLIAPGCQRPQPCCSVMYTKRDNTQEMKIRSVKTQSNLLQVAFEAICIPCRINFTFVVLARGKYVSPHTEVGLMFCTSLSSSRRYVNIGQPQRSKDELVAVLRSRLMPVPVATGSKLKNGN